MSNFALFRFWLTVLGIILATPAALWWINYKDRRTRRLQVIPGLASVSARRGHSAEG